MPSATACKYGVADAIFSACVDTNLVYDNSLNDKSSWVESTSSGDVVGYWDLGSAQSVDNIKCTVGPGSGSTALVSAQLAYSNDASTWTNWGSSFASSITTFTSYSVSGGTVSARYWRLKVIGDGMPSH